MSHRGSGASGIGSRRDWEMAGSGASGIRSRRVSAPGAELACERGGSGCATTRLALPAPLLARVPFLDMAGTQERQRHLPGEMLCSHPDWVRTRQCCCRGLSSPGRDGGGSRAPISRDCAGWQPGMRRVEAPPPLSPAWCWRLHFQEHFQLLSLRITKCHRCTNQFYGVKHSMWLQR